jgi:hypothetical protein
MKTPNNSKGKGYYKKLKYLKQLQDKKEIMVRNLHKRNKTKSPTKGKIYRRKSH